MSMGSAYFPFTHCHSRDERKVHSTFSERVNRFTRAFLFSSMAAQRRCSLTTRLGCLSIFFFNTRHTVKSRNTARGVPAFSDSLFGKCKPLCQHRPSDERKQHSLWDPVFVVRLHSWDSSNDFVILPPTGRPPSR